MTSNRISKSSRHSGDTETTGGSSAYDDNFEQHLVDQGIYPERHKYPEDRGTPKPENLGQFRQRLLATRPSLSPSRDPDDFFLEFQEKSRAILESTVMHKVIPLIAGNDAIPTTAIFHLLTSHHLPAILLWSRCRIISTELGQQTFMSK